MKQIIFPSNHSGLNFSCHNDGDSFKEWGECRDDGWVYNKDGKRLRKWFIGIDEKRVWGPVLKHIPALERRRWNITQRAMKKGGGRYDNLVDKIRLLLKTYDMIYGYRKENSDDPWCAYHRLPTDMVYWDFKNIKDVPENSYHDDSLINEYFNWAEERSRLAGRTGTFTLVLEAALAAYLDNRFAESIASGFLSKAQVKINGRIYWMQYKRSFLGSEWVLEGTPENDVIVEIS